MTNDLKVIFNHATPFEDLITQIIFEGHNFSTEQLDTALRSLGSRIYKVEVDQATKSKRVYVEKLEQANMQTENRQLLLD